MNRSRRLAAAGLGLVLAVAANAPQGASAQDGGGDVDGDQGWSLDASIASDGPTITVAGEITPPFDATFPRMKRVTVHLALTGGVEGCEAPESQSRTYEGGDDDDEVRSGEPYTYPDPVQYPQAFTESFELAFEAPCNGTYTATVTAVADRVGFADPESDDADDVTTFEDLEVAGSAPVSEAAPSVTVIRSRLRPDRKIAVGWDPPSGYGTTAGCGVSGGAAPPDFLGYAVQRKIGTGEFTTVALQQPGELCWIDHLTPTSTQGTYQYRVLTRREGPGGEVVSAASSATVVTVEVGPPTTTPTTAATTPRPSRPRPSNSGANGGSTGATVPPTITDDTFQETLDYEDEEEPGELAADVPDDADTFLDFVPAPGAGILEPFAIAACLAVWAMHLRYLARRSDDGI